MRRHRPSPKGCIYYGKERGKNRHRNAQRHEQSYIFWRAVLRNQTFLQNGTRQVDRRVDRSEERAWREGLRACSVPRASQPGRRDGRGQSELSSREAGLRENRHPHSLSERRQRVAQVFPQPLGRLEERDGTSLHPRGEQVSERLAGRLREVVSFRVEAEPSRLSHVRYRVLAPKVRGWTTRR